MKVKLNRNYHKWRVSCLLSLSLLFFMSCDSIPEYVFIETGLPESNFEFATDGLSVNFVNNSIHATSYFWDFGDGATSTELAEVHAYAQKGKYNVTLTVTDDNEETNSYSSEVPVGYPRAIFVYEASKTKVAFDNQSSNSSSYLWDFGDGSTSTDENPVYTFADAGTYSVSLVAIDGADEDTYIEDITVLAKYQPIILNPSFEDARNEWTSENANTSGSPTPPDGSGALKLSNAGSYCNQTFDVDAGDDYKMWFWVVSKVATDESFQLTITDGVDASIVLFDQAIAGSADDDIYEERVIEFNAGSSTSVTLNLIHFDDTMVEVRIDNFSIK